MMMWIVLFVMCFVVQVVEGVTRYASPTGVGVDPCTTNTVAGACTMQGALAILVAGDVLVLKDGVYTGVAGMLVPPAGKAGTSGSRITVQAENDGAVLINGQNVRRPVSMGSGVAYWTVKGFNACCAHDTTIQIGSGASNIRLERVIAWDQEDPTAGVITVWQSSNTVLVDVAAWGHGRKMMAVISDTNTVVNRGFFIKHDVKTAPNNGGMTTTYAYHSLGNRFYNTISSVDVPPESSSPMFNYHAIFAPDHYQNDTGVTTTHDVRGNIAYHVDGQNSHTTNAVMRNSLNGQSNVPVGNSVTTVSRNNLTMRRVAAIPGIGHDCPALDTRSICDQDNWTDSVGSLAGGTHTTEGTAITPSAAPDLLQLASATQPATGAWIRFKHTDAGALTAEELWPWPMNQRIKDALVTSGRSTRGINGAGETDVTALILSLAGSSLGPTAVLHLTYTTQPQNVAAGAVLPSVSACVYNTADVVQLGHVGNVVIALQSNPGSAVLGGTTTVATVNGCAVFNNLTVSVGGTGYTLRVTSTGVTQVDSAAFNVTTIPISVVGNRVRTIP